MNWFFWTFTLVFVAYVIFTAATADNCTRFVSATRLFRSFVLSLIYFMYGSLAIIQPDAFGVAENTFERTSLEYLTIVSIGMTVCMFGLFVKSRPSDDTEQAMWAASLKKLKWHEAAFDLEDLKAEWRHPFTHHKK